MSEAIILRKASRPLTPPTGAPSVYLKGMNDVAVQFPMWLNEAKDRHNTITWWAEGGLVKYVANQTQEYGAMSWRDAAQRVLGLSEMVFRSSEDGYYRDERQRIQQFIADMEKVIATAKAQGGGPFTDDEMRERKRRRPTSVIVPKEVDLSFL